MGLLKNLFISFNILWDEQKNLNDDFTGSLLTKLREFFGSFRVLARLEFPF